MFLSRCQLNSARRGTVRLLASPQAMHAAVEASFPESAPSAAPHDETAQQSRVLWRVDQSPHHMYLYVVSQERPDFTHIVEQAGWPTRPHWDVADYLPMLDGLTVGQRWQFRLTANPVHNAPQTDGSRGKRYAHVTAAQQEQWLLRRADWFGVVLGSPHNPSKEPSTSPPPIVTPTFRIEERSVMRFPRKGKDVTIRKVRYDGILEVSDADLLRTALISGVGAAKAYGCGLLTLAPVPSAVATTSAPSTTTSP